jgi:predicted DNA-binding ribbon-helix-helix protein
MKSVAKRSVIIGGRKTSVSLEEPFWSILKEICAQRGITLNQLVSAIDANRQQGNLSSAIRLFVLDHFRSRAVDSTGLKVLPESSLVSTRTDAACRSLNCESDCHR